MLLLALIALRHKQEPRSVLSGLGLALLFAALVFPKALHRANLLWMTLGRAIGKIATPVGTAVLFIGVVTPVAWLLRLFGKNVLRLGREPPASSYWIAREPGPTGESMKYQF